MESLSRTGVVNVQFSGGGSRKKWVGSADRNDDERAGGERTRRSLVPGWSSRPDEGRRTATLTPPAHPLSRDGTRTRDFAQFSFKTDSMTMRVLNLVRRRNRESSLPNIIVRTHLFGGTSEGLLEPLPYRWASGMCERVCFHDTQPKTPPTDRDNSQKITPMTPFIFLVKTALDYPNLCPDAKHQEQISSQSKHQLLSNQSCLPRSPVRIRKPEDLRVRR